MTEDIKTNQRFSPEWDSEDTSNIDDDFGDPVRDTETGALIGVVGGAVVGAFAGGPIGAVIGGVLGGIGGGVGVAAVDRIEHPSDYEDQSHSTNEGIASPYTSPYPGDAGRTEAVQFNGVGLYDSSVAGLEENKRYAEAANFNSVKDQPIENIHPIQEDWHAEPDGSMIFRLPGYPDADQVSVAATFNNWSTTANPMRYLDGWWITEINLPPGKHQYRYVVDGSWISDPTNPEKVEDGGGNVNSIIVVERDIVNPVRILG